MQILGKRSKILLIAVAIVMLVAIGVSFAAWDSMSTVRATSGNSSTYANAKVGEIIEFGEYYQTGNKVSQDANAEYEKTPIRWIVVDKDERTGQLTLMSEKILAAGSYFGNHYYNAIDVGGHLYQAGSPELDGLVYNQAYLESTARAFLNNLERRDLGGDSYANSEFITSATSSNKTTGELLPSVGFSNSKYFCSGKEYKRPIGNKEYRNRPATRGFYDEAFTDNEKSMILPKVISGYTGFRWTCAVHEPSQKEIIESVIDKVWLPSTTELNLAEVEDYNTTPSDEVSSTALEYFKNYKMFGFTSIADALKASRTDFVADNSMAMNFSIPVYQYRSTAINDDISTTKNSEDIYWTRSASSLYYNHVRYINDLGAFGDRGTHYSPGGVRPCVILKY